MRIQASIPSSVNPRVDLLRLSTTKSSASPAISNSDAKNLCAFANAVQGRNGVRQMSWKCSFIHPPLPQCGDLSQRFRAALVLDAHRVKHLQHANVAKAIFRTDKPDRFLVAVEGRARRLIHLHRSSSSYPILIQGRSQWNAWIKYRCQGFANSSRLLARNSKLAVSEKRICMPNVVLQRVSRLRPGEIKFFKSVCQPALRSTRRESLKTSPT